jgi:hypothetical protein
LLVDGCWLLVLVKLLHKFHNIYPLWHPFPWKGLGIGFPLFLFTLAPFPLERAGDRKKNRSIQTKNQINIKAFTSF